MDMVIGNKILNTCLELFLKYGIKSVSMDDIARELGMSKKTIYEIYKSKDDLVFQTVREHMANEMVATEDIVNQSSNAMLAMIDISKMVLVHLRKMAPKTINDLKKYHKDAYDLMHNDFIIFIKEVIEDNIKKGIKDGLYRKDLRADIISKIYISMMRSLVDPDTFPLLNYTKADLYKEMIDYHLRGVATAKGLQLLKAEEL